MRCEPHGLACGPDGRCVLCRKEGPASKAPAPRDSASKGASVARDPASRGPAVARDAVVSRGAAPRAAPPSSPARSRLGFALAALTVVGVAAAARLVRVSEHAEPEFHSVTAAETPSDDPATGDPAPVEPAPVPQAPRRSAPSSPADSANAAQLRMLQAIANAPPAPAASAPGRGPTPLTGSTPMSGPTPLARPTPIPTPVPAPAPVAAAAPIPRDVRVIVYTTDWCPVCKRAKAWMQAHGVAYEERDVEASIESARSMRAINPRGGVPTFDVEGQVMIGFSDSHLVAMMRDASQRKSL